MTASTSLISILMPTYNRADRLPQAVRSVLMQTGVDLELLVIDDGSNDDTPALLRELAVQDERMGIVTGTHSGMAVAINAGFAESRGAYISQVHDDDALAPGVLAAMLAVLIARPEIDIVYTDWIAVWEDDIFSGKRGETRRMSAREPAQVLQAEALWSWLCRRRVWSEMGGYDPSFGTAADFEFWRRVQRAGYQFAVLHEPCYIYRYHKGGLTYIDRDDQLRAAEAVALRDQTWRGDNSDLLAAITDERWRRAQGQAA